MITEELRLMAIVAYLYYKQQKKQSDIAKQLDISQSTVSRLLKRAEAEEIVRITVSMPSGVYTNLENELCHRYDLKSAIVVDCAFDDEETIQHNIGTAAAYYVETTIRKNETIGLSSWSASLLAMVNAMHPLPRSLDVRVVQILGSMGNPSAEVYASRLTERFTKLVQGTATYLPAPGVAGSRETRDILLADQFVQEATSMFDEITLALVGIGAVEPSKLLASSGNVFSNEELNLLRKAGAVGDIGLRFIDEQGSPVKTTLDDRVISMKLDQLKKIRRSVAIAGGPRKVRVIRGVLEGGWINVLITNRRTAERILDDGH